MRISFLLRSLDGNDRLALGFRKFAALLHCAAGREGDHTLHDLTSVKRGLGRLMQSL
jgi:hypothetical protein